MVKIKKYANVIERMMRGEKGQRFFNFAYSIGAAIVIWGALFKILHLPGGSTLLCIGMGTEIAMFILTAFDRPPKEYAWEEVFPQLDNHGEGQSIGFPQGYSAPQGGVISGGIAPQGEATEGVVSQGGAVPQGGGFVGGYGGGVIIGGFPAGSAHASGDTGDAQPAETGAEFAPAAGGYYPATVGFAPDSSREEGLGLTEEDTETIRDSVSKMASLSEQLDSVSELAGATGTYLQQINGIAEQMARLESTTKALNDVSETLLNSYKAITGNSDGLNNSSTGYVEQMEDLNRNISGLNTIYAIQLKSISSQLESIDRVNRGLKDIRDMYEKSAQQSSRYCEETEKMARYMKQLNSVYEKMITAMTVNMANPMMGASAPSQVNPFSSESDSEA